MSRLGIRRGIRRLFRLAIRRPTLTAADIEAEIDFHLRARREQLTRLGYSAADAEAEAHRRFGDVARARHRLVTSAQRRENVTAIRERLESVVADVRVALRGFRRTPGFVVVSVLTLALGIGANTTVFTWMNGLVLNPLPLVADARHLVALTTLTAAGGSQSISYPDYLDWSAASRSLRDVVVYRREQVSLRVSPTADAAPIWAVLASSNYFDVLGIRLARGRGFHADESAPLAHAGSAPIVVIGYDLWQREFGGRDDVIGKPLWLNGHQMTVVGVAPDGFHGSSVGFRFDLWAPITMQPTLVSQSAAKLTSRNSRWAHAFARLAPGVSVDQARSELVQVGAAIAAAHPEERGVWPTVDPLLSTEASGLLAPIFAALFATTTVVLLIVALNLAVLQLVRTAAREQEFAVRMALGAGGARIVQQFLVEAGLIVLVGAAAALAFAYWARGILGHFLGHSTFPIAPSPPIDGSVLAFAIAGAATIALLIAVQPAIRASRRSRLATTDGNRSITSHGRARELLVVVQLALSLVGVTSAGLLLHSLARLRGTNSGFIDPTHVLLVSSDFDLAGVGYAGFSDVPAIRARRLGIAGEILARARALPGVRDAALMDTPALGLVNGFDSFDARVAGYTPAPNERMAFEISYVTPGFFSTVGPSIVRGRAFTATDRDGTAGVVVVNEAFARRFWPGDDAPQLAVGKMVTVGGKDLTIIGVVADAKFHWLGERPQPFIYLSYEQWSPSALTVALRTDGDPLVLVGSVRRVLHDVEPAMPLLDPRTLEDQVDGALTVQRLSATVVGWLAALALTIAALGLYGVLAQAVQQRYREIGIRMALGARDHDILRQFTVRGLALAGAGVALGVPGVLAATRLLRGQLYGIGPADPVALCATAAVFLSTAMCASIVTARRATRVDPATSVRAE